MDHLIRVQTFLYRVCHITYSSPEACIEILIPWGKQANVEGIPRRCSSSRITVEALATTEIGILHSNKKAHSKFRDTRRGGVCYAGVILCARLSKDHSVSCRKQQNTIFFTPVSLK